jgi:hypothetical protein
MIDYRRRARVCHARADPALAEKGRPPRPRRRAIPCQCHSWIGSLCLSRGVHGDPMHPRRRAMACQAPGAEGDYWQARSLAKPSGETQTAGC